MGKKKKEVSEKVEFNFHIDLKELLKLTEIKRKQPKKYRQLIQELDSVFRDLDDVVLRK